MQAGATLNYFFKKENQFENTVCFVIGQRSVNATSNWNLEQGSGDEVMRPSLNSA